MCVCSLSCGLSKTSVMYMFVPVRNSMLRGSDNVWSLWRGIPMRHPKVEARLWSPSKFGRCSWSKTKHWSKHDQVEG